MEAASCPEALQELKQHLFMETEPSKLYRTLQKLASLPKLCDTLAEMNFHQTMKLLRKEQLLVPFAKDLAAIWSERCQFGPHPEPDRGDFAFALSMMTLRPRNCAEYKPCESGPREHRQDGTEVSHVSSSSSSSSSSIKQSSPGPSPSRSPSPSPGLGASLSPHTSLHQRGTTSQRLEPRGSKRPRVFLGDPQLAARNQVPAAKPRGSTEEPWWLQAPKASSSKSDPGGKTPGQWMEEGPLANSLEACLNSDSSPPFSALQLQQTQSKRRGKSTWKAVVLSPGAKVSQGKSDSCQDPNGPGHPLAEDSSSLLACFPLGGQEQTSFHIEEEDLPCARRRNFKTPVYSGPARDKLLQKSQKRRIPEPLDRPLPKRCQDTAEETEPWQQEEESYHQTHRGKPTHTQTESATIIQLQESPELRLQALRARLQGAQARKPQGRQTKMIAFQAQATSPRHQAESGPGEGASSAKSNLQEASAHRRPRSATCLQSRVSNKPQPKKPAPLMAKSIRHYKKR